MLDMGFRPAVDRIVSACPADRQTLFFSATLDGETGRIAEAYTRDPARHEHVPAPHRRPRRSTASSRSSTSSKLSALIVELRRADGLTAGVRAYQARRRPAGQAPRARRRRGRRHARRQVPAPARVRARALRGRQGAHAGRDRRRRPRHRRRGHRARDQLRPSGRPRGLRPPRRPAPAAPAEPGCGTTFVRTEDAQEMGRIAAALELHDEFSSGGFAAPPRHVRAPPRRRAGGGGGDTVGQAERQPGDLTPEQLPTRGVAPVREPICAGPTVLAAAYGGVDRLRRRGHRRARGHPGRPPRRVRAGAWTQRRCSCSRRPPRSRPWRWSPAVRRGTAASARPAGRSGAGGCTAPRAPATSPAR